MAVYFVSTTGNDAAEGSQASPFASISYAATIAQPGDVINVRGGTYRQKVELDNIHGRVDNPITIKNYQDEEVVLSGAQQVTSAWERHEGNIWTTTSDVDITQLFLNGKMLTAARWPNIDTDWDYLDATHNGKLPDGNYFNTWARNSTSDEFGVYHNNEEKYSLTDLNISLTGAMLVPQKSLQRFDYTAAEISAHQAGSNTFELEDEAEKSIQSKSWKNENSEVVWNSDQQWARGGFSYYITNHLGLLDQPSEWHYDESENKLYVWLPDGQNPNDAGLNIEARVFEDGNYEASREDYLLSISNSSHLVLKGINTYTGAFKLDHTTDTTFEDSRFLYIRQPGYMLGSDKRTSTNNTYNISGDANLTWRNCEFANSYDGMLIMGGLKFFNGITIDNCYFHNIARGSGFIAARNASDFKLTQSTVHTGAYGGVMQVPKGSEVSYNHFYGFYFDGDDSVLQVPGNTTVGTTIHHNWIHDAVGRNGIRFDGNPAGIDGTAHHNVLFRNRRGSRWKGDQHTLLNNLAFHNTRYDIGISEDKFYGWDADGNLIRDKNSPMKGNFNSVAHNNAGNNNLRIPQGDSPENKTNNWERPHRWGRGIENELMDVHSYDFRPKPSSTNFIDQGKHIPLFNDDFIGTAPDIGAYEYGAESYWIPGHQTEKARIPIPFNGATTVSQHFITLEKQDADLIWLPAREAKANRVWLGTDPDELTFYAEQTTNIFDPGSLNPGTTYYWRIDTVTQDDLIVEGDVWSLTPDQQEQIIVPDLHIGDPGNSGDLNQSDLGSVDYSFYISETEITNEEYAAFLTATNKPEGSLNPKMQISLVSDGYYLADEGVEEDPVSYVSFWNAARFANWLSSGDPQKGVYKIDGQDSTDSIIARNEAEWQKGGVAVASHDEWYKSAYYSGTDTGAADGSGYWNTSKQADSIDQATEEKSHYGFIDKPAYEWTDTISNFNIGENGELHQQLLLETGTVNQSSSQKPSWTKNMTFRVTSLKPIGNGHPQPTNAAPAWLADQWSMEDGYVNESYSYSIKSHAIDSEDELLAFQKLSGPSWLTIQANGEATGTPSEEQAGVNEFVIQVSDPGGLTAETEYPVSLQVLHTDAPQIYGLSEGQQIQIMEDSKEVVALSSDEEVAWTLGGEDGNLFQVLSSKLSLIDAPDWESPLDSDEDNIYNVSVIATNTSDKKRQRNITVEVLDDNVRPTGITMSKSVIPENTASNTIFAKLITQDANIEDNHSYQLADGDGDLDNDSFSIVDDQLVIKEPADYETKDEYFVRIQSKDNKGLSYEQPIRLTVSDENDKPISLNISNASVMENSSGGTVIGQLSTLDPDNNDAHRYELAAGLGNEDNTFFAILDDKLVINHSPDYETKNSYNLRVRSTDKAEASHEQALNISVGNRPELIIPVVKVSDGGNSADNNGHGNVEYDYYITESEITNSQYATYLNDIGGESWVNKMAIAKDGSSFIAHPGREDDSVTYISFEDAVRFANWATTGDTNQGVYDLTGSAESISRDSEVWASGGASVPSLDEWYKAAYYSGEEEGADGDGYWHLASQVNTSDDPNGKSHSHYGLIENSGWEWTDTKSFDDENKRILRGGSASSEREYTTAYQKNLTFRLSSLEPIGNGLNSIDNLQPIWQIVGWKPAADAGVGDVYSYSVSDKVSDPENDPITFSMIEGPNWISVESDGSIRGTPDVDDLGDSQLIIRATDSTGLYHDTPIPLSIEVVDTSKEPIYEITSSPSSLDEGLTLTTVVNTTNVEEGSELYWKLAADGDSLIIEADLSAGDLTGTAVINADGQFTVNHQFANDQITEGTESLRLQVYSDPDFNQLAADGPLVEIFDTSQEASYHLSTSSQSIYEGEVLTTNITTAFVEPGTELHWSISGAGINQGDFEVGALTGSGQTDADGKFSFSHTLRNDQTREGPENLEIKLFNDDLRSEQVGNTASVEIKDTSMSTNYVLRGDSAYVVVDGPSWQEADAYAQSIGGNLVTINDEAENEWLLNAFKGEPSNSLHIGLKENSNDDVHEWASGETSLYRNWEAGEPNGLNDGNADQTVEFYLNSGRWNDHPDVQTKGIAEISLTRASPDIANQWTPNPQATADSDLELSYSLHTTNGTSSQTDLKQLAVLGDSVDWSDTYRLDITAKSLAAGYNLETADITINFDPFLFNEIKASDITIGGQLPIANAVRVDNDVGSIRIAAASLGDLDPGDLYGNHLADAVANIGADAAVLASIELDFNEFRLDTLTQNSNGKILDPSTPLFFGLSANQDETVFSKALDNGSGFSNREIKSLRDLGGDLAVDGTKVTLYEAAINLEEQGDGLILSTERVIGSYDPISTNLVRSGATISTTSTWTNVGNIEAQNIQVTGITNSNAELVESESYFAYQGIGANGDQLTRNSLNSGRFSPDTGEFDSTAQESGQLHAAIKITGAAGNVVDLSQGILSLQAAGSDVFKNQKGSKNLITFQGDLNYDGRVSMKDLAYLNAGAARQQQASEHPDAVDANSDGFVDASVARGVDANFDGQISMADLAVLDADWGQSLHQQPINGGNGTQSSFTGSDQISWDELDNQGTTGDAAWDNQAFKDQNAVEAGNDFVESLESPAAVGVIGADGNSDSSDNDIAGDYFQDPLTA